MSWKPKFKVGDEVVVVKIGGATGNPSWLNEEVGKIVKLDFTYTDYLVRFESAAVATRSGNSGTGRYEQFAKEHALRLNENPEPIAADPEADFFGVDEEDLKRKAEVAAAKEKIAFSHLKF